MKTKEQISKIQAVVNYILEKAGEMDYIHLFKIMYFAQQDHLVTYGLPIMDDSFLARRHGAVPALTYKVIKNVETQSKVSDDLNDYYNSIKIHTDSNGIQIVGIADDAKCDLDELSVSNIKYLDKWIEKCKDIHSYELSDLSHDKAWKRAKRQAEKTGEDTKITLYDMAEAGGAKKGMLEVIRERQSIKCALYGF